MLTSGSKRLYFLNGRSDFNFSLTGNVVAADAGGGDLLEVGGAAS